MTMIATLLVALITGMPQLATATQSATPSVPPGLDTLHVDQAEWHSHFADLPTTV